MDKNKIVGVLEVSKENIVVSRQNIVVSSVVLALRSIRFPTITILFSKHVEE